MNIAVIDADLIGRKRHRFPNLTCMKLSGYHKSRGDSVTLKTNYDSLPAFDRVYIAKVFTDTPIPSDDLFGNPLELPNVEYGGTEFKAYKDYSIGFLTRGCFRHCSSL